MNAEIELKNNIVLALPEDAIVSFEGKKYIYMAKQNNQFEMIQISIGETENGFTEIIQPQKSELSKNEFVIKGAYSLLMTMKNKEE
jgi:membrane fusion protein, heavy metal efflux system